MERLDDTLPVEVAPGIWWVGFADHESGFSNNPYLLVDGDDAILFDPGPGHAVFRDLILDKLQQIVPLERIRHLVVHHQDPDLCAMIPFIEGALHPEVTVLAPPHAALFVPYYGIRSPILPVGDGDVLELTSGRRIRFIHLPYVHFVGNMVSYDGTSRTLFSSDLFGGFARDWELWAGAGNLDSARSFLEYYVDTTDALRLAHSRLRTLAIDRILPQHGSLIGHDVEKYVALLAEADAGVVLRSMSRAATDEELDRLLDKGRAWLEEWSGAPLRATSFDELLVAAAEVGVSAVPLLIEQVGKAACSMGVSSPFESGRVHKAGNLLPSSSRRTVLSMQRRALARRFGQQAGALTTEETTATGLLSVQLDLAVVFIDIRGFTAWSECHAPDEVIAQLNRQLELTARIIRAGGGRINKLLGDGIFAYFPARELDRCVDTLLEIPLAIGREKMLPMGVGCDVGRIVMGDVGEESRLDFTLLGATVNRASRLCDTAGPGQACLSRRAFDLLRPSHRDEILSRWRAEHASAQAKKNDPEIPAIRLEATDRKEG